MPSFKNSARGVVRAFLKGETLLGAHKHARELDKAEAQADEKERQAYRDEQIRRIKLFLEKLIGGAETVTKISEILATSGILALTQNVGHLMDVSVLSKQQVQQLNDYAEQLVESRRSYLIERMAEDRAQDKSQRIDEATRDTGNRMRWNGEQRKQ